LKIKYKNAKRPGFSLTEMLVVVLIMGVLVGVVGSLMGGFVTNFEMTDDQSIARRRAQDVFNILQTPILNAGLGIPSNNFDYFFGPAGVNAPIRTWGGPIEVITHNTTENRGDALRIVYSVFSGVKNVNSEDIKDFSSLSNVPPGNDVTPVVLFLSSGDLSEGGGDGIQIASSGAYPVRSYVTFPGIWMHPEVVTNYEGSSRRLTVAGKTPETVSEDVIEQTLGRNVIRPYHDMFLVRAGLAYVDNNGTFCMYDINDGGDAFELGDSLPTASEADAGEKLVYRVEGIKAVRFVEEVNAADGRVTGVNVYVLAEGDNAVTGRTTASPAVQAVRNRVFPPGSPHAGEWVWPDVNWDDEMYYDDFEMRWRTRNIEATTP
jgi:prepilin-type N-terminal cleavage/methylation domain-containing protein